MKRKIILMDMKKKEKENIMMVVKRTNDNEKEKIW